VPVRIEGIGIAGGETFTIHQANPVTLMTSKHRNATLDMAVVVSLTLLTIICYAAVRRHEFVDFDDPVYIVDNQMIHDGVTLDSLRWALTTGYAGNWHPLTWVSHMIDCQLFGVESGPHHLINLGLHCLNTALLFVVLQWMTGQRWASAFVAALFAVHPLHVESVAWVSERKDVLSTLFWILTLLVYTWYARRGRWWRYALVMLTLSLGLMAKPMLVTLPVVLLLLDYWPLGRYKPAFNGHWQLGFLAAEKVPLLALSAISSLLTIKMQSGEGAIASLERWPLVFRFGNVVLAYVAYLRDLLWPVNLAYFYPPHEIQWQTAWQWLLAAAAMMLLVLCSACAVLLVRRAPFVFVGWLWFIITLIPVIGIVQVGEQARADRYMYVPLIGPEIIVAWLGLSLGGSSVAARRVVIVLGVVAIAACIPLTMRQVDTWRDSESLFTRALAVTSENHRAHTGLGRVRRLQKRMDEAIWHYRVALAYKPNSALANHRLGIALALTKQWVDAEDALMRAVAAQPRHVESRMALARVLRQRKQLDAAIEQYRRVVATPKGKKRFTAEAVQLAQQVARIDNRLTQSLERIRTDPNSAEPRYRLAWALYDRGRFREAEREARIALSLRAHWPAPHVLIATVSRHREQYSRAANEYQRALEIAPHLESAKIGLSGLIVFLCHHEELEVDPKLLLPASRRLLELEPESSEANWLLGRLLASAGDAE